MKERALPKYHVIEKHIGETPLEALERLRKKLSLEGIPLAYAGRLDPMAEGKLLILVGDECKRQKEYHSLDKEYHFEVLLGAASDTGDVLGIVKGSVIREIDRNEIRRIAKELLGPIELPYPHFSAKTVRGKPLHTWTLEGRLGEITIPMHHSTIHNLTFKGFTRMSQEELSASVREKVNAIPPVIDARKALGRDFRRVDVLASWEKFSEDTGARTHTIASFVCTCSSGTYMRSLSEVIAKKLGTCGLAYGIRRTRIGRYAPLFPGFGLWIKSLKDTEEAS